MNTVHSIRTRLVGSALVVAGLAIFAGVPAHAQVFTHAAPACVPDEGSLASHEMVGGKFKLLAAATGTVAARCNVIDPLDAGGLLGVWTMFQLTYQDPDGMGLNTRVRAMLYRVPNVTANPVLISTVDSNTSGSIVLNTLTVMLPAGTVFDFLNNAYFVLIEVSKAPGANADPFAAIVRLRA